jgi:hypothetical protein
MSWEVVRRPKKARENRVRAFEAAACVGPPLHPTSLIVVDPRDGGRAAGSAADAFAMALDERPQAFDVLMRAPPMAGLRPFPAADHQATPPTGGGNMEELRRFGLGSGARSLVRREHPAWEGYS